MSTQKIQLSFDKDAVWAKVRGRLSVFLDTNCWIDMADEASEAACRVRDSLKALVAAGRVFCPTSWGILEELFEQTGESLKITSGLMEELSLNVIFVMRTELFRWEFLRSVCRLCGGSSVDSLSGLFAPPFAFVGSEPCILWNSAEPLDPETQESLKFHMKYELSRIGVVELAERIAETRTGSKLEKSFPAYSEAAKK
ncbi:MAG TPA: hypothetical protein VH988_21700 [Thermoanaerobaculia bacterium]|jgi:hypothetical protein|nr:hypothetical protein [Thermoanaerobaculia bacterium]